MNMRYSLLAMIITAHGIIIGTPQLAAASDKEEFIAGCLHGINSTNYEEQAKLQTKDFSPAVQSAALRYNSTVVKSKEGSKILCNDLYSMTLMDPLLVSTVERETELNGTSETAMRKSFELSMGYFIQGLKRLKGEETIPFFEFNKHLFGNISPEGCAAMITGKFSQPDYIEKLPETIKQAQMVINDETQVAYYEMAQKAVIAEFEGKQHIRPIGRSELIEVEEKFGRHLLEYGERTMTPEKLQVVAHIMMGKAAASDKDYCDFGILYFGALASMSGAAGDKIRKVYIEQNY